MAGLNRLAEGYEPNFDIDAEVGHQGVLLCQDVAKELQDASKEVKTDMRARQTKNLYVEYECFRQGEWRPSGIATTSSEFWVVAIDAKILLAVPIALMCAVHKRALAAGWAAQEKDGSHPTKGSLIPLSYLLIWALEAL